MTDAGGEGGRETEDQVQRREDSKRKGEGYTEGRARDRDQRKRGTRERVKEKRQKRWTTKS